MNIIDILIIVLYLILMLFLGFWVSKRGSKSVESYFLGGKNIPWYILGVSNASGMFDITGTMWMVSILFIYGLKSVLFTWIWPVWNQVFLMVFLAIWLRRSNVLTGAEWLKTRFGTGRGATMSHIIVVIFAVISCIGFISYGFVGIGKFSTIFFPWDLSLDLMGLTIKSEKMYALIIMSLTVLYVIKGGLYSVVITELAQFVIMCLACIFITFVAMNKVSYEQINDVVPQGWKDLSFDWIFSLDWSKTLAIINDKIGEDGYSFFGILVMLMLFKGISVSIAGPVPSYDMQRVLATRTPKCAAKMSGFVSVVLMLPRYLLITSLTVLALVYYIPIIKSANLDSVDFEKILPYVINEFIPVGLTGLILAGLISAFMSTFAANVNAGPAYLVNDIYKRFINKNASNRRYINMSYLSSFMVVALGILLGFFMGSIDSIMRWIFSALFGGYAASNLLKWVWWRFNGYGYFWGMLSGLIASLFIPMIFPNLLPLRDFPIIFLFSLIGCFLGTLLTKPDEEEVLKDFYKKVKPWGFWGYVHKKIQLKEPNISKNKNFFRDMFNCVVGIIWQFCLMVIPIYLVIREYKSMILAIIIFVLLTILLKYNWYDKIKD